MTSESLHNIVQMDKADVIASLRDGEGEFFIQTFLGTEIDTPVPKFHNRAWNLMKQTALERIAIAIPRAHAKTTLAKLVAVWYFLFTKVRYCAYISNTMSVAKDAVRDILGFMQTDNFVALFGAPRFVKQNETEGLFIFFIGDKRCTLRAAGAGKQIRGWNVDNQRPELAIVDDLEDLDNASSITLVKKLKKWFYGPFMKAMDPRGYKIIVIGNILTQWSLIKSFCESKNWSSMRLGCVLSNGQPLWPEVWSLEKIKIDFMEYMNQGMLATWFAEMMNIITPEGRRIIDPEKINLRPVMDPLELEVAFITIDPAIAQGNFSDKTAIVVHGIKDGHTRVVDYAHKKMTEDEMFFETVRLCREWKCNVVGIEAAAFQGILKPYFEVMMLLHNITNMEIVPLKANKKKTERIRAWCGMLAAQSYSIVEGFTAIVSQLLAYDTEKKDNDDDLIDSCAYGVQMLENFLDLIYSSVSPINAGNAKVQTEVEICGI